MQKINIELIHDKIRISILNENIAIWQDITKTEAIEIQEKLAKVETLLDDSDDILPF